MSAKSKRAPKERIAFRVRPEVLEMLRRGAAYHGIGYQTYMQWLIEEGLKAEVRYYGWGVLPQRHILGGPTKAEQREIQRLMRLSERRMKAKD